MRIDRDSALVGVAALFAVGLVGGVLATVRREDAPARNAAKRTPPRHLGKATVVERNASRVQGSADAPYRLIEFMDYQCPPCRMANASLARFVASHADRLSWSVREFPLPMHENARPAALLALAGSKQVPYARIHEALMRASSLDLAGRRSVARELGLDSRAVLNGVPEAQTRIAEDEAATKAFSLDGTPSLILCTPKGDAWLIASPADIDDVLSGKMKLPS